MLFTRRNFLSFGLGGAATLLLPGGGPLLRAETDSLVDDPHFFLMIVLKGGADTSYMFDGRPLAMTEAGRIQNYLGAEPEPWTGRNGVIAPATSLVKTLMPFHDRFSILNGVVMTPSFDGHEQNMNFLFTGDPFGGRSFIPHLNLPENGLTPGAVDAIVPAEPTEAALNNHAGVIPLEPKILHGLPEQLRQLPPAHANDPVSVFVRTRLDAAARGQGVISNGAKLMRKAIDTSPEVHAKLAALSAADASMSPEEQCVALISECFRLSLSRAAIYVLPEQFDVHAPELAKSQPQLFGSAIEKIAALFKGLIGTPYDAKRSMLDVTTVMVTSEFGRTMRAPDMPIDATGTNHNQYSNTILLGGKGIRSDLVIGASDMRNVDENVSKAHLAVDPILEKTMGRPFDFSNMTSRDDLPAEFNVNDYLTVGSVINTVYSRFNVPDEHFRKTGHNADPAPILRQILT